VRRAGGEGRLLAYASIVRGPGLEIKKKKEGGEVWKKRGGALRSFSSAQEGLGEGPGNF